MYSEKLLYLRSQLFPPHIKVVQTQICTSKEHLIQVHKEVIERGGKGIELQSPSSTRVKGFT